VLNNINTIAENPGNVALAKWRFLVRDASADIWDTKYRLKTKSGIAIDGTIDETYQRVATALSSVEIGKAKQTTEV
jgi:hypothetical protein